MPNAAVLLRAKNIRNKPRINEDPKDAMLREFQEEIKRLRDQLAVGIPCSGASLRMPTLIEIAAAPKRSQGCRT